MAYRIAASKMGRLTPVLPVIVCGIAAAATSNIDDSSNNRSSSLFSPAVTITLAEPSNEHSVNLERWYGRWSTGTTRWHRSTVHPALLEHIEKDDTDVLVPGTKGARILVPLCGKTVDLAYLAASNKVETVVGVDGIRKALDEFAQEHAALNVREIKNESISTNKNIKFERFQGDSIVLLKGDFFDLDDTVVTEKFDVVWDRAAMVAIQPALRQDYVGIIRKVLKRGGTVLLSVYVRPDGSKTKGPPFLIDEEEVRRLYHDEEWVESVELLSSRSALSSEPWYKAIWFYLRMGNGQENIFLIRTKK